VNTLTKRIIGGTVLAGLLGTGLAVAGPAVMSDAAVPTVTQSLPGYSWNGYRAAVTPTMTAPTGYTKVSSSASIAQNGKTLAANFKSFSAKPGTYRVHETVTYKNKVAITQTPKLVKLDLKQPCVVTRSYGIGGPSYQPGDAPIAVIDFTCTAYAVDAAGQPLLSPTGVQYFTQYKRTVVPSDMPVGATWNYGAPLLSAMVYVDQGYTTHFDDSTTTTIARDRIVTVKAVKNAPLMSRAEMNSIKVGDSLSRVRQIAGTTGKLQYATWYSTDKNGVKVAHATYLFKHDFGGSSVLTFTSGKLVTKGLSPR
jgi:hypothetical protein